MLKGCDLLTFTNGGMFALALVSCVMGGGGKEGGGEEEGWSDVFLPDFLHSTPFSSVVV